VLTAIAGYDARDPLSIDDPADFTSAVRRSIKGMRIAYTRNYDVFPIDRRIAAVIDDAVGVFEQAGAHVEEIELGITRDQRELSDLWCRLIMPLNVAGIEGLKAMGYDVIDDLPPQYREWLDRAYHFTPLDIANDQAMRTEVFDAFQDTFSRYDLIVGPTLCALPVANGDDGNTVGPTQVEGVEVDPLIGWCPTYLVNYTVHPAASIPAGMTGGLPVGLQIIGRSYADADVLAASAAFERLRPWRDSYRIPAGRALS
jgi:amidase